MPTVAQLDDLARLEEEAAMLRDPSVAESLSAHQRSALVTLERRIAELRQRVDLATKS
jgi:hypothetical protein